MTGTQRSEQKFFGAFFQKRTAFFALGLLSAVNRFYYASMLVGIT
jgi:hypothetical protein